MTNVVEKAVSGAGGIAKLAAALGIRHQSIYSWRDIPALRVLDIERATGIPRHELRPDLYPAPAGERAAS